MHSNHTPVTKICEHCGTTFTVPPRFAGQRCCSVSCAASLRNRGHSEERTCPVCGVTFRVKKSKRDVCCSWACRTASMRKPEITPEDIGRFWSFVDRRGPDDCWEWQGATDQHGYGKILWPVGKVAREPYEAHRISFEIARGRPPVGLIRHQCDNPPCVNPAHLLEGDQLANMGDAARRDRTAFGSRNGQAKLSEQDVMDIRSRYIPRDPRHGQAALGREYGVSRSAIGLIVHRKNWRRAS